MTLNEANLEKKLNTLSQSQESIQTLSQFCLHYKNHHKRIAQLWMRAFQRAKPSHRLTLVYLANEIVQNAKRKNSLSFICDFRLVIKETIPYLKDQKIKKSTERVFDIWRDRNIYDAKFITELKNLLNAKSEVKVEPLFKIIHEFKQDNLIEKLKLLEKFETNTRLKEKDYDTHKAILERSNDTEFVASIQHNSREKLKFEDAIISLQTLIKAREKEHAFRRELYDLCVQGKIYHEEKLADAKASHDAFKRLAYKLNQMQSTSKKPPTSTSKPTNNTNSSSLRTKPSPNNSDDDLDIPLPNSGAVIAPVPMDIEEEKPVSLDTRLTELLRTFPGLNQLNTEQVTSTAASQPAASPIPVVGSDTMRKETAGPWIPGLDMQKPPLLPPNLSIPPPPLMPPQLPTTILPFDPSIMQHAGAASRDSYDRNVRSTRVYPDRNSLSSSSNSRYRHSSSRSSRSDRRS